MNTPDNSNQNPNQNPNQNTPRTLNIKQVFLKQLDFKTLVNPMNYEHLNHVESLVNININHEQIKESEYLISLTMELEGFDDEKRINKIFKVLVEVFGIFEIENFDAKERNLIFYGFCANTLFPYVRAHISNSLSQSGFKPILLNPINFEHLYLSKLREKQQEETRQKNNANQNQTSEPNASGKIAQAESKEVKKTAPATDAKKDKASKLSQTKPKIH